LLSFILQLCSSARSPASASSISSTPSIRHPQPLDNTIGAIALFLLAFVVVTSYMRIRLGRHLWKSFHFSIYFAAAALFWHSLFTDPASKNAPIHWADGGKLFVESCLLLIAAISLLRLRLRLARKKAFHARQIAQQTVSSP